MSLVASASRNDSSIEERIGAVRRILHLIIAATQADFEIISDADKALTLDAIAGLADDGARLLEPIAEAPVTVLDWCPPEKGAAS